MKTLGRREVFAWCQDRSIMVSDGGYLYFDLDEKYCLAIELPQKPYQLIALANALIPFTDRGPFRGAILWIREWGVWSELVERCGYRVMEAMRLVHGNECSLQEAPGYLFDAQELIDLQVCFLQPLLIGWDGFLVPQSGDYIVATSHDEITCVLSRTPKIHQKLRSELEPWGPREDREWYFKGIGVPTGHT